jgi:hypothetical protein
MKLDLSATRVLMFVVTCLACAAAVLAMRSHLDAMSSEGRWLAWPLRADAALTPDRTLPPATVVVSRPPAPDLQVRQVPTAVEVRAEVLVADMVHDASRGRIALPSGTRLQLRLAPSQAGRLEVHALNSVGERTALWSARVAAGSKVDTPRLVLEGRRGLETLQVLLRARDGRTLAKRDVQLWHQ